MYHWLDHQTLRVRWDHEDQNTTMHRTWLFEMEPLDVLEELAEL